MLPDDPSSATPVPKKWTHRMNVPARLEQILAGLVMSGRVFWRSAFVFKQKMNGSPDRIAR